jgi:hypothetical protein
MRLPDDSQGGGGTSDPGSATTPSVLACDECGAPVDAEQRYCVVCGAHRRNVNDPAARYLSQASAKSRGSKAGSASRRSPQFGGSRGVVLALVIALIPAAAAAGVIAGRSSNNDDSNLIQALKHHQSAAAQTTTVQAKAGTRQSTTIAASTNRHHAAQTSAKSKPSKASKSKSKSGSGSSNGKASATSSPTSTPKIVGAKATQAQKQQGASVTQKVQKSTGKNFVNGQNSLPGEVVVP